MRCRAAPRGKDWRTVWFGKQPHSRQTDMADIAAGQDNEQGWTAFAGRPEIGRLCALLRHDVGYLCARRLQAAPSAPLTHRRPRPRMRSRGPPACAGRIPSTGYTLWGPKVRTTRVYRRSSAKYAHDRATAIGHVCARLVPADGPIGQVCAPARPTSLHLARRDRRQ